MGLCNKWFGPLGLVAIGIGVLSLYLTLVYKLHSGYKKSSRLLRYLSRPAYYLLTASSVHVLGPWRSHSTVVSTQYSPDWQTKLLAGCKLCLLLGTGTGSITRVEVIMGLRRGRRQAMWQGAACSVDCFLIVNEL